MKKLMFKRLVVSSETIRCLGAVELGAVAGGLKVPVGTTHSITSACIPILTTTEFPDPPPGMSL